MPEHTNTTGLRTAPPRDRLDVINQGGPVIEDIGRGLTGTSSGGRTEPLTRAELTDNLLQRGQFERDTAADIKENIAAGLTPSGDPYISPDGDTEVNKGGSTAGSTTPTNPTAPVVTATPTKEEADVIREQLQSNLTDPQLPAAARQTYTALEENPEDFLDPNDPSTKIKNVATQDASTYEAATARLLSAEEARNAEMQGQGYVSPATAAAYEAAKTAAAEAQAATKGTVTRLATAGTANATEARAAIQELDSVDPRTTAKAVTRDLPESATVEHTLNGLLQGLESGNVPTWAQPAVDAANARMAAAGLSTSSVGRNALFNSIIQAAMPIAQQDAQAKLSVFSQNLNNEQQAALANSQFFQTLSLKNLDNAQQAAILNATNATNVSLQNAQNMTQASIANSQAFLQMDMANLNNAQQSNIVNAQLRQQSMLSNQSAENTSRQFNASSQAQADQFNANLAAQIAQFNATQLNTSNQFNANAENAMSQFNSNLAFQRDQFNVQNATAILQSNVQWRRQMNQLNTAGINAVNQANAMNQFNLSNQALTFLWQEQRDLAKWANDNAQNEEERRTRMAIAALGNESMTDAKQVSMLRSLATAAASIFDSWGD